MQEAYIKSDELFNSIKEDFYSYDNAGLIDDGQFYRHVTYILGLLGATWYVNEEDFIEVTNYKATLPSNFYLLDQAYRCHPTNTSGTQPDGVILREKNFGHFPIDCQDECVRCPVPTDCILNEQSNLVVQRNNITGSYRGFTLLSIGNSKTKSKCKSGCANLYNHNPDSITIQGNFLYTNFEKGTVYLRYYAYPIDEETGLPLIPNNERIMKCMEYYIKSKILENFWVNGDGDVAQKITYFQQLYRDSLGDAQYETKLPTFNTMLNNIRLVRKKLDVYQLYPASSRPAFGIYNANIDKTFI